MKTTAAMALAVWVLCLVRTGQAAEQRAAATNAVSAAAPSPAATSKTPERGLEAARALTTITGVAISPLLGVGTVGAWDWFRTPPERRARLHWYAQPWFWIPALLIVAMVGLKDVLGTALPTTLKKPFDVAEVIENKISGLVAVGAFVPLMASIFSAVSPGSGDSTAAGPALLMAGIGLPFLAAGDLSWLGNVVTVPVAMVAFVLVWLVSHTINILIILSPWGVVDAALKSFRLLVLAALTSTAFINPYVGAACSVVLIIICWFLAGWSFRLMIFGSVFAWDFFTLRRVRFEPAPEGNWMFTARRINDVPIRTYGRLRPADERQHLVFEYRPWLFLPRRKLVLPEGDYAVGRGLIFPEVIKMAGEAGKTRTLLWLPPRCRGHEDELARLHGFLEVRDVGVLKGVKGAWNWLKDLFGWTTAKAPEALPAPVQS